MAVHSRKRDFDSHERRGGEKKSLCTSRPPKLRASGSSTARPGSRRSRRSSCCTVFPRRRTSSTISFRFCRIGFMSSAPDYPGMGFSEAPAPTALRPTFDDVATVIDAFIAQRAPGPLILYLHDISGPIGIRFAMAHPERIAGLILQNFTTSVEGWNPERLKVYERLGEI